MSLLPLPDEVIVIDPLQLLAARNEFGIVARRNLSSHCVYVGLALSFL
jgi:hypothetical protein